MEPAAPPNDNVQIAVQALGRGLFRLYKRTLGRVEGARFEAADAGTLAEAELSLRVMKRQNAAGDPVIHVAKGFEIAVVVTTDPPGAHAIVRVEGAGATLVRPYAPGVKGEPGRATVRFDTFSKNAADVKTLWVEGRGDPQKVSLVVSPHQPIWANYPDRHADPKKRTHTPCESLTEDDNHCAARMSEAIERAGFSIAGWKGHSCGCKGTGAGSKHLLRAEEVAAAIDKNGLAGVTLGPKTVRKGTHQTRPKAATPGVTWKDYEGQFGLVYFEGFWPRNASQKAHRKAAYAKGASALDRVHHLGYLTGNHVDIWNGEINEQGGVSGRDYFERSREVWFWPLH